MTVSIDLPYQSIYRVVLINGPKNNNNREIFLSLLSLVVLVVVVAFLCVVAVDDDDDNCVVTLLLLLLKMMLSHFIFIVRDIYVKEENSARACFYLCAHMEVRGNYKNLIYVV